MGGVSTIDKVQAFEYRLRMNQIRKRLMNIVVVHRTANHGARSCPAAFSDHDAEGVTLLGGSQHLGISFCQLSETLAVCFWHVRHSANQPGCGEAETKWVINICQQLFHSPHIL